MCVRLATALAASYAIFICFTGCQRGTDFPPTDVRTVVDEYHGVRVEDPYRWLEDSSSEEVGTWTRVQNEFARSHLDSMPEAESIRSQLRQIFTTGETVGYSQLCSVGQQLFALKFQPPKQQALLVVLDSPFSLSRERVVVDPEELDSTNSTTIDWYRPSPDGRLVGVSLSQSGAEAGDLHVFDVTTGESLYEMIPRVNGGTAGGDMVWAADGQSFLYTRYPRGEERPEEDMSFYVQVYRHSLGSSTEEDLYELGESFPRIAEIRLDTEPASGRVLATVQRGDSGDFEIHLRDSSGEWRKISSFGDGIVQAVFGPDDSLLLLSYEDAPRGKIVRLSSTAADPGVAEILVAETELALESSFYNWYSPTFWATDTLLYAIYQAGGPSELQVFDHAGRPMPAPEQFPVSSVNSLTPLGGDDVLFANQSYIEPKKWFAYRPAASTTTETVLSSRLPVDFSDLRVEREMATSIDGTEIPVNIVMPKTTELNGSRPILVTGYGGYGMSMTPFAVSHVRPLFDRGFLFAEANLRGGGEFGKEWHEQGRLTRKQNVFDDFIAVLRHLVDRGYTSPERIAIMGGSNGGLLMGAVLTQEPGLVGAVVSSVGIYDSLRSELSPNGEFNIPEFGTVQDETQFKALYAYSPYHNVRDGLSYPATLFITGANDPRVDPMHSRKMTARLQAAQAGEAPILLRTDADTGHGVGTPLEAVIEELTDSYAFIVEHVR